MIFDDLSNELFDYRMFLIRYNLLFNSSRLIKKHKNLVKELKENNSFEKLVKILKEYRNIVKVRDFKLYEKLVINHNKLLKKLHNELFHRQIL